MKKIMIITSLSIIAVIIIIALFLSTKRIIPLSLGIHNKVYAVDKIALNGYDVTSYFDQELQKGNPAYSFRYMDNDWYFSTPENLDLFKSNPKKFVPEFGGYCGKAISTGFAAPSAPTVFSILEGKLYLFSSEEVQKEFAKNPSAVITACERKWK